MAEFEMEIPNDVLLNRLLNANNGAPIDPGGKHILVACVPKSGSTFISAALSNLPDFTKVNLTYGFGHREQELAVLNCALLHGFNYVAQHHVRFSQPTEWILKIFGIFPVVLLRNLYDCVASLYDHLHKEDVTLPMAYIPVDFQSWNKERKINFIIDFILPWYANFISCWAEYSGPMLTLTYGEAMKNPGETIGRIASAAGLVVSAADIERAMAPLDAETTRFNVGRVGRGFEMLSRAQVARIRQMFSYYSSIPGVERMLQAYD
jgi:hypothetical protein